VNLNRNRGSKFQDPDTTIKVIPGSGPASDPTQISGFEKNRAAAKTSKKQLSYDLSKNFRGLIPQDGSKFSLNRHHTCRKNRFYYVNQKHLVRLYL
jgi:hypothetical protein